MHKILVVDDEKLICKAIKSMIERLENPMIGEVIMAHNARDAEKIILDSKPDIVVTDICMPITSGLDLIRKIKQQDSELKFIVLSGYDEFQYAKEAIKLGVVDYLLKPATFDELKEVMDKTLDIIGRHKNFDEGAKDNREVDQAMVESSLNRIITGQQLHEEKMREILSEIKLNFPHELFCIGLVEEGRA